MAFHQRVPLGLLVLAGVPGFFSYQVSLTLFVRALWDLGTARTGTYLSTAPFLGVALSLVLLRETLPLLFWPALVLMAVGVWLHLSERHEHVHKALEHELLHTHDEQHQHSHSPSNSVDEPHSHWHRHDPLVHTNAHTPDLHHQHRH